MTSSAIWTVPATCGEFVQGFHRGRWLQIAAPVDLYRTAFAEIVPFERADPGAFGQYTKVRRGLGFLLHERPGCSLRVTLGGDDIPRGPGFGSSTADMGAALCAAADALGLPEPCEAAVDTALRVEPTNGSLLPGLVLFDHRAGTIREALGPPPPLKILCIRLPGAVDTVAFNRRLPARLPEHALTAWDGAFRLCADGIARGDLRKIGVAATASAETARHLGSPPAPPGLAACVRETTSVGFLRAHSGTVWGLLYPATETPEPEEVVDILGHAGVVAVPPLPESSPATVSVLRPVEGGCRVVPPMQMPLSCCVDARGPPEVRSEADAAPPL